MSKLKEINDIFYQECEVVMLATDKATWPNCIWLGRISNRLRLDTSCNIKPKSISPIDDSMLPKHLYFLSNEEIKEGDWFIANKGVFQCLEVVKGDYPYKIANQYNNGEIQYQSKNWLGNKIIATTDISLNINNYSDVDRLVDFEYNLPQPSKQFIQAYVKSYNEGEPITKVLVEYKDWCDYDDDCTWGGLDKADWRLKLNSSNEITIKKIKDSYTREEVEELTYNAMKERGYTPYHAWQEWAEENL